MKYWVLLLLFLVSCQAELSTGPNASKCKDAVYTGAAQCMHPDHCVEFVKRGFWQDDTTICRCVHVDGGAR